MFTDATSARIMDLTHRVGRRLHTQLDALIASMNQAIESAIDELDDPEMMSLLHASVANNAENIVSMLVAKKPADQIPPVPAATEYAIKIAQQNVSGSALRRAYHIGTDPVLAAMFEEVQQLDCEPQEQLQLFRHLAAWVYRYVDVVTRVIMQAYEDETRRLHDHVASTAAAYIGRVLNEQDIDSGEFLSATGYRLDQVHIAALVWLDGVNAATDNTDQLAQIARWLTASVEAADWPLITAVDRTSARVWFGKTKNHEPVDTAAVAAVIESIPDARVAFGAPRMGANGFRASLAQAEHVATVARVASPAVSRVVSFSDEGTAMIATLAENVGLTRQWVLDVLGPLASASSHAQRQRQTMRVFLESSGSYTQTAEKLIMHRNSIKYRLTRAEQELGHPLNHRQLDIRLALALCQTLGNPVLTPAD